MLSRRTLLAAAAASSLALPAGAAHAAGWSVGVPTSAPGAVASQPVVAADGHGGVTAAWLRDGVVQAGVRGASGAFAAVDVSAPGAGTAPALAVDGAGRAILAWVRDGVVEAAIRPGDGQPFGAPAAISRAGAGDVRVGIDAAGTATVLWIRGNSVEITSRAAGDAAWPAEHATLAENQPSRPALAVAPSGRVVATWSAVAGATYVLRTVTRPGAGAFGTAATVEDVDDIVGAGVESDLAADGPDDVTGVWAQYDGARHPFIRAGRRVAGAAFGPIATVSLGEANDTAWPPHPALAANAAGDAAAIWLHDVGGVSWVELAQRAGAGAAFTPAVPVSAEGGVDPVAAPDVAVDGAGRALATWLRGGVVEAVRTAGGAASAVTLSDGAGAGAPRVAADGDGGAVAVWAREGRIETAAYDAVAPQLDALAGPAAGGTGQALAFRAQGARDGQSAVRVRWDFGDGGAGEGEDVTHRFTRPGTFTVTATAIDGGGNTAARTAQVVVTGAPAGDEPAQAGGRPVDGSAATPGPAGPGGAGSGARDRTAPRLSGLAVTPRRPRAGGRATVRLTLDEGAKVTIRLARGGRRVGAPVTRTLRAGRATIRLAARLRAGRHTVTIVAVDAAGNAAKARTLTLVVAAPRRR
jgi:hypothetical protein